MSRDFSAKVARNVPLSQQSERRAYVELKSLISPITDPRCPEDSRKLGFPDYVTVAQQGDKVVSLTDRSFFTPRKYSWYSFPLEAESTPGP